MPSPLTPRVGYVVTLSQFIGARPVCQIDCHACHWRDEVDAGSMKLDGTTAEAVGEPVRAALMLWLDHVSSHISEPYPSEVARVTG